MKDAILVSPAGARWPETAQALLRSSGVHVVRITSLGVTGLMLLTGDVDAVVVDRRCLTAMWRRHLSKLSGLSPRTRFVIVRDDDDAVDVPDDSLAWPSDEQSAIDLLGFHA